MEDAGIRTAPFSYSSVAISTDLNCAEVLSTPRPLSSTGADIAELLIQNQLFSPAGCEFNLKPMPCITQETLWPDLWLWEILI